MGVLLVDACLQRLEPPKHLPETVERVLDKSLEFINLVAESFGF
jgi:hypothetical protein